jgi:hypothetical protein
MTVYDKFLSNNYIDCIKHWYLTKYKKQIPDFIGNLYYQNYWSRDVAYKKRNTNRVFVAPIIRPDNSYLL